MIVADLQIVACLNIYLCEADARSSMVSGRFLVVAASFWAPPSVPGNACVLNPLIVVADPNLAACPGHHGCAERVSAHPSPRPSPRLPFARCSARLCGGSSKRAVKGFDLGDEWTPSALPRRTELLSARLTC